MTTKCALCDGLDVHVCPGGIVHGAALDASTEIFGPKQDRDARDHDARDHQVCSEGFLTRIRPEDTSRKPRDRQ